MKRFTQTSARKFLNGFFGLLIVMIASLPAFSQNVAINPTGAAPNANAGLDVDFANKGLLIPRVALTSTASFAPLSAHVNGMMVYNTATAGDVTPGFYYNDGTKWIAGLPSGTSTGDMLYWNGTTWVKIPAGLPGQFLQVGGSNIPGWAGAVYATITTTAVTAITATTATTGGNITADGGYTVLTRGVCYSTSPNPTTANSIVANGTGIGSYVCNLSGLTRATTYYVRAYATNSSVTTYGNQQVFTTLPQAPTVAATTAATLITSTTATSGGNVTNDGGATITERGICYGTTSNPTTANLKVTDPAPGVGVFSCNMSGLTPNTLYYVRAYAINSVNTTYGTQISFYALPTVTTAPITNLTPTTATGGGNVTSAGTVTQRGVCWSTSPGPTVALTTKTLDGTTAGAFTSSITGLSANTLYYVRAYATNGSGTSYGTELTFTTPFIITATICTVNQTIATSGGTISAAAGLNITERGVVWSTSPAPTTADFILTDPSVGPGTYVSNLTGLTDATTYYIRAYCINNGVTVYANELNFKTGIPKVIGQDLAGGKVIYVDCSGQHGLIGGLSDLGSGIPYGTCAFSLNIGIAQGGGAIYAGLNNTNVIIANCGTGTAAQLCAAYTAGGTGLSGITNWYLPSHDELQIMVDQRLIINLTTTPSYAGAGVLYWASTEYNASIGYCHYSLSAYDYNNYKYATYYSSPTNLMYVRPIRAF
jgi:hypothetical protein